MAILYIITTDAIRQFFMSSLTLNDILCILFYVKTQTIYYIERLFYLGTYLFNCKWRY